MIFIELRLNFTNDKAIHEDFKSYNQIYHLITENEYEILSIFILLT